MTQIGYKVRNTEAVTTLLAFPCTRAAVEAISALSGPTSTSNSGQTVWPGGTLPSDILGVHPASGVHFTMHVKH